MRLIIVSNRLPVKVEVKNGHIKITESAGGLASGIKTYLESYKKTNPKADWLWAGWPGAEVPKELQDELREKLSARHLYPIFLTKEQENSFYNGFCNDTLWPLFHYFSSFTKYSKEQWATYREVNELFACKLQEIIKPADTVWVHDYHFMLLPKMLREKTAGQLPIGFFLHIPFPYFETYRLLPDKWRRAILSGMLGADLVGFHTYDYTQYFVGCVSRILGYEHTLDQITLNTRSVRVDTFPIGIDFQKFNDSILSLKVLEEKRRLKQTVGSQKVILSLDRLDYTKGIGNRLRGYELFLEKNPQLLGKVVLVMVVVPSRAEVGQYQEMKGEIDELAGKINGRFGSVKWTPIIYQYKALDFAELAALYNLSDIALVTPLRDGMNMIAKEYIASRKDQTGVLVLSEMAGAASELGEAIIVNPNHPEEVAAALEEAFDLSKERQVERNQLMQQRLKRYDVVRWGNEFIKELEEFKEKQLKEKEGKILGIPALGKLVKEFLKAKKRLILSDYDGCLVPFAKYPPLARPSEELLAVLHKLGRLPETAVAVITGRDRTTIEEWLKPAGINLSAEHGAWIKEKGKRWRLSKPMRSDWKETVLPVIRTFVDRVPGTFLEEKEFSLVWHYRMANQEMANLRAKELINNLTALTANTNIQVLPGNKIVEVRTAGMDKGSIALYFLDKEKYDFILAIGDDTTDEDMYKALPETAHTIKVRAGQTAAKYILDSPKDVLQLLNQLIDKSDK